MPDPENQEQPKDVLTAEEKAACEFVLNLCAGKMEGWWPVLIVLDFDGKREAVLAGLRHSPTGDKSVDLMPMAVLLTKQHKDRITLNGESPRTDRDMFEGRIMTPVRGPWGGNSKGHGLDDA